MKNALRLIGLTQWLPLHGNGLPRTSLLGLFRLLRSIPQNRAMTENRSAFRAALCLLPNSRSMEIRSIRQTGFPTNTKRCPKGRRPAQACARFHLVNGNGHPESANLAGLNSAYFVRQMQLFKSGARKAYATANEHLCKEFD